MSNLIPTKVTDKNGKLTTVHKKADTGSAAKSAALAGAKPSLGGTASAKQTAADKKKAEADAKVQRLLSELELGVEELMTSEGWQRHLDSMSKFHNYSFNNQWLIHHQMPHATKVSSYKNWGELGRQVNKGEKAISVLAPMMITLRDKEGNPVLDDNGKERKIPRGYRAIPVFDISQTSGEELPEDPTRKLDGDAPYGMRTDLEKFIGDAGYTVEFEKGAAGGVSGKKVVIDSSQSEAEQARAMAYELGRITLGHFDKDSDSGKKSDADKAVEAESFAYVVSRAKGLNSAGSYSFGQVSTWAAKSGDDEDEATKRVRSHGRAVADAVKGLLGKKWPNTDA